MPGRETPDIEIFGMEGVPYDDLQRYLSSKTKKKSGPSQPSQPVEAVKRKADEVDEQRKKFIDFQMQQQQPGVIQRSQVLIEPVISPLTNAMTPIAPTPTVVPLVIPTAPMPSGIGSIPSAVSATPTSTAAGGSQSRLIWTMSVSMEEQRALLPRYQK
jgi:hypothetical protein